MKQTCLSGFVLSLFLFLLHPPYVFICQLFDNIIVVINHVIYNPINIEEYPLGLIRSQNINLKLFSNEY